MQENGQAPKYRPESNGADVSASPSSSSTQSSRSPSKKGRLSWLADFLRSDPQPEGVKTSASSSPRNGSETETKVAQVVYEPNRANGVSEDISGHRTDVDSRPVSDQSDSSPVEEKDELDWEPFNGLDDEEAEPLVLENTSQGADGDQVDEDRVAYLEHLEEQRKGEHTSSDYSEAKEDLGEPLQEPDVPAASRSEKESARDNEHIEASPPEPPWSTPFYTNGKIDEADAVGIPISLDPPVHDVNAADLGRAVQADTLPEDEVVVEEIDPADSFDRPEDPELETSFDGSSTDLPQDMPVADTNWAEDQEESESESMEDALDDPELHALIQKDRVVATIAQKKLVTAKQLLRAKRKRDDDRLRDPFWRILTTVDGVNREAIFEEAARVYAFPKAKLGSGRPDPDFARKVMDTFDEEHRNRLLELGVLPYDMEVEYKTGAIKVVFITHDPTRTDVNRMIQKLKLERFELLYAPESALRTLITEAFPRKNEYLERIDEEANNTFDLGMEYDEDTGLVDEDALEAEMSRSKLINLFEATLVEATRQGVSDVHIWPNAKKQVEIHFRLDGRLQRWHVEDKVHPEALIAVIKDNSMNVDRFERDAAQDGFIQRWIDDALIRFRVSVMPIANAASDVRSESIVIRVLDDRKVIKDLRKLGLQELAFERFKKAISQPHGMVILTGPTGSGKTTTLYAALHEVVSPEVNVLTVEDPVEYILPGVRQIKLNHKLGLEDALRSILRHDPDVVMVGEMRDRQTAELAIKLANTGHLTFSTLHTNDSASAVTRLYKMGIEPFLIAYAINLVVAQRLIRKLCTECRVIDTDPDPVMLKNLGFSQEEIATTTFYKAGKNKKCPGCGGLGFKGRRAITEALYFNRDMRHLIADSEGKLNEEQIKEIALRGGMLTLQDSARLVVLSGETSAQEMMRVVASRD